MPDNSYEPTKAEMLAALVIGNSSMSESNTTVQRSHRFPLHLLIQIENMSRAAEVPVSVIINQLIECGLEAVRQELPEKIVAQLNIVSKEQVERPTKPMKVEVKRRNPPVQAKSKTGK